jgi:LAGLIDADG DNA endonuclease family
VPLDLTLTPLSLAVWYMDDGTNSQAAKSCNIASLAFSLEEVAMLTYQIHHLGITAYVVRQRSGNGQDRYFVRIPEASYLAFVELVRGALPDVPECMSHKVDLSEYKGSWKGHPTYQHPYSKVDQSIIHEVGEDAKRKVSQQQIATKHGINRSTVRRILLGSYYKPSFVPPRSGVTGVCWNKRENKWRAKIRIKGQRNAVMLGTYDDIAIAIAVITEAVTLHQGGITDIGVYQRLRQKGLTVAAKAREERRRAAAIPIAA